MLSLVGRMKTMHFKCFIRSLERTVSMRSNKYTSFCSMSDWLNAIEIMLVYWPNEMENIDWMRIHFLFWWKWTNPKQLYRILIHEQNFHARSRFISHFVDVKFHSCYHIHNFRSSSVLQFFNSSILQFFNLIECTENDRKRNPLNWFCFLL